MTHGITNQDSAMYVGKRAWHGLGTVVEDANLDTFVEDSGIGAPILEAPIRDAEGNPITGWKYLQHSGNGNILNVCKESYKVIQPAFMQECCDALRDFGATPESAFSMFGGKEAAVVLSLGQPLILPLGDDAVYPYVIMHNTFDGSACYTLRGSTIRAECRNMLNMAFGRSRMNEVYRIHHKGDVEEKQEDLIASITGIKRQLEQFEEAANKLSQVTVSEQDRRDLIEGAYKYINEIEELPQRPGEDAGKGEKNRFTRWENFQAKTTLIYHGPTCDKIRGTAWGVLNSITEHIEYGKNVKERSASRINGGIARNREAAAEYIYATV